MVFYQVTLIPIPTRSTNLTSKRKGNCYIMIMVCMWSSYVSLTLDLHMSCLLYLSILTIFTISPSSSYCLIVVTTSSFLYQLGHQSTLALSGVEVLRIACEPNKQFVLIVSSQKKAIYRPTPFWICWWWSERNILMLYKEKPQEES